MGFRPFFIPYCRTRGDDPLNYGLRPSRRATVLYLAPFFLIFLFMKIVPLLMAGGFSFYKFSNIRNMKFIGLDNYVRLFHDKNVLIALKNNLFLVVVCMIGQIGIAFFLANLLNAKVVRFAGFHRTVMYFPVTISPVIIGFIWQMVYNYNYGILPYAMRALGLAAHVRPWLSDADSVMFFVCLPMIWQYIGFQLVIIMAAMTSIDASIYEMAQIDGAGEWQKARYITLPLLRGTLSTCVVLCISANIGAFDHIMAITGGGPGNASMVLALYTYKTSFTNFEMGYGSALSIAIFVITAVCFVLGRVLTRSREG